MILKIIEHFWNCKKKIFFQFFRILCYFFWTFNFSCLIDIIKKIIVFYIKKMYFYNKKFCVSKFFKKKKLVFEEFVCGSIKSSVILQDNLIKNIILQLWKIIFKFLKKLIGNKRWLLRNKKIPASKNFSRFSKIKKKLKFCYKKIQDIFQVWKKLIFCLKIKFIVNLPFQKKFREPKFFKNKK